MSRFREEIGEQPLLASRMLAESRAAVAAIAARVRGSKARGFVIAARGSSDHAALYAKYLFGIRNRMMVTLAAPSMFTSYGRAPNLEGQCVIGISQSGSAPDVLAVIEEASRQGLVTIAVTNDPESRLAQAAELQLPLGAGPESSVPASKTYTASLLALALVSQALDPDPSFEAALGQVPPALAAALEQDDELDRLVPALLGPRAIVLGRGFNFSTAEEIALKLTETSYVLARAWSVADFVHGPIAVVEPGFPVVLVDGRGQVSGDMQSIGSRLAGQGCRVVRLLDGAGDPEAADATVSVDSGLPEELTPLTLAVLGQLLAHRVAMARGIDPDRPRALDKVTRTW
ncbi:MAG TPA: SIS domain-containing protein [Candidatus Dormibacteraeota bacterium]|nr:SIS domain-containing protein [Candidatus Dormibacteraeota bacterium]